MATLPSAAAEAVGPPPASAAAATAAAATAAATTADADAWEPGTPSLRAMGPGALMGLVPFAVYELVHPVLGSQVEALLVASAAPALWVAGLAAVQRRVEPIGVMVLVGLVFGAVMAAAGGGAYGVKARDGAFAALCGAVCLASLAARRPVMFHLGKALSAGADPERRAAFDALWEMPAGARTFRVITVSWGVGALLDAALQFSLAAVLPTSVFLVVGPAVGGGVIGGLFAATVWYSRRARRLGEAAVAGTGLQYPSVPRR